MIFPPNSPRQNVVGGFAIQRQAQLLPVSFTANVPWIGLGGAPAGFAPTVGDEIEFVPGDANSGLPFVVGAAFNWRGPWAAATNYAVNDVFVWFDGSGVIQTWLVVTNFTSGSSFATSADFRQLNFRGGWAAGTAYLAGDVVRAPDPFGVSQTWVALSNFTSGGSFVAGSQWAGALAAQQVFYIVAVSAGTIQISTTPTGSALNFLSSGFFQTPDVWPSINAYLGVGSFGSGSGLVPALSLGALFAQGVLWQPSTTPTVPAAPANQFSYLAYNSTAGLYWTTNPAGTTADDAVLGWVETNATDIIAASGQNIYTYGFPLNFFGSANAADWGPTEQLPNANIALFNAIVYGVDGAVSDEGPVNYSQSIGGLIQTGIGSGSGFLAHAVPSVVAAAAALNFAVARSMAVTLTAHTTISAVNTTGLGPFLWVLSLFQDSVGFHAMIPGTGLTVALSTDQSPPNTYVTGLFFFDGAGNHILLSSTGDQPIP